MKLTRVLIVDDCLDLRKLMSDFLGLQKGIIVIGEASDGIEAIEFLAKNEVDIVLLDIMLPKMDGFEMLGKMRSNDMCNNPNVIVMSALSRKDYIKRAYDLGVGCYIIKPFKPDELLYQIRRIDTHLTAIQ